MAESPANIYFTNEKGEVIMLERLEPSDARWSLGMYQAPDGNMDKQFEVLKTVAIDWADNMRR